MPKFPIAPLPAPLIAHRGYSSKAPENTYASFELAYQSGVRWLETDVQIISDNTFVLFHDEHLDRCTDMSGMVSNLTHAKLPLIDAGSWFSQEYAGEQIPVLEDFLNFVLTRNLYVNLELKLENSNADPVHYAKHFVKILQSNAEILPRVLLSSFDYQLLVAVRSRLPEVPIAYLAEEHAPDAFDKINNIQASSYHIAFQALSKQLVSDCLSRDIALRVYTVNSIKLLASLLKFIEPMRISGFFTDDPLIFITDPSEQDL
ncbi:MAG: glycerophosphodiester phosphodiesterase family protein [Methylacidiphilales bacterium]|nr:glycerophosphodiester phosphodiesterase family protein [Candidatus Methylacidiphilales bacterium]